MTSLRARVERLERMAGGLRGPSRLDAVDVITLMDLATQGGSEDVAALWRRNLEETGVEDDGSREERIGGLRAENIPPAADGGGGASC